MKKKLSLLLKIGISLGLLYFVFSKIDTSEILKQIQQSAKYEWLTVSILLFISSQLVSSYRLNYIFQKKDFPLSQKSNLKLYFLGMFYNFFIPGGIGGDAYKVYILNKRFGWNIKKLTSSILSDRLIGLGAIIFIISILGGVLAESKWIAVGILVAVIIFLIGKIILQKLFNSNEYHNRSFLLSICIQLLQIGSIYAILKFMQIESGNEMIYFTIFLISSVLSVVSFAGFGAREYVFLQASIYFSFDKNIATSIGLLFNLITMIVSLIGICFLKPKLSLQEAITR